MNRPILPLHFVVTVGLGLVLVLAGCGSDEPANDGSKSDPKTTASQPAGGESSATGSGDSKGGGSAEFQPKGDPVAGKRLASQSGGNKCQICHAIDGKSMIGNAPAMDAAYKKQLLERVAQLGKTVEAIRAEDAAKYAKYQETYDRLLGIDDMEHRLAEWLRVYLPDPSFDLAPGTSSLMAPVRLSNEELDDIVAYVLSLDD